MKNTRGKATIFKFQLVCKRGEGAASECGGE